MNFTEVSIEDISFKNPQESDIPGFGHLCALKKKLGVVELPELKVYSKDVFKDGEMEYIDLLLGRTDKPLYSFMNELDKRCLECIHENSADWYGQEVSLDILENYYKKSVRTEKGLPLLRVTVSDSMKLFNADDEEFTRGELVKHLGKSKMARVSVVLDGLRIEENSICVNMVVDSLRTASSNKSLKVVKKETVKEVETVAETEQVEENVSETVQVAKDESEVVEDETEVSNVEGEKEVVETEENVEVAEEPIVEAAAVEGDVVVEDDVPVEENTIEDAGVVERNIELSREDDVASVSSRSSRSSRASRHSRISNRTAMSSQMSEQMDLVKRMHREAVKAERYANKKRMEAVRAVHELRNLELAEMSSNYNAYNIDDASEFIETTSYMDS